MSDKHPVDQYLLSLDSEKSRIALRSLLRKTVETIDPGKTIETFDWSALSYDLVMDVKNQLFQQQKKAPSTINTYLAAIKGVAKACWYSDLIDNDTFTRIKEIPQAKGSRVPKGRALELDELNRLLDYCMALDGPIPMRDAALIALIYGAGLRREEATDLQLSDYRPNDSIITVIGKGNKERINALNPRIVDIVNCWIQERGNQPGPLFTRIRKGGRVTDNPISGQSVYNIVCQRYQESGLARLSPHDLRRTYATKLLESNVDLLTVQKLMGHTSVETTKRYDKRDDTEKIRSGKALPL